SRRSRAGGHRAAGPCLQGPGSSKSGHLTSVPPRTGRTSVRSASWFRLSRAAGSPPLATSPRLARPSWLVGRSSGDVEANHVGVWIQRGGVGVVALLTLVHAGSSLDAFAAARDRDHAVGI